MNAPDQDAPEPTDGASTEALPGADAPLIGVVAGAPARSEPATHEPLIIGHPSEEQLRQAGVGDGGARQVIDPRRDVTPK